MSRTIPQPGTAELQRHADGTVTVLHADPVIQVDPELIEHPDREPWLIDEVGVLLQLDTVGAYRYELIGAQTCTVGPAMLIFRRIGT